MDGQSSRLFSSTLSIHCISSSLHSLSAAVHIIAISNHCRSSAFSNLASPFTLSHKRTNPARSAIFHFHFDPKPSNSSTFQFIISTITLIPKPKVIRSNLYLIRFPSIFRWCFDQCFIHSTE